MHSYRPKRVSQHLVAFAFLFFALPLRADHQDTSFEYSFAVVPQFSAAKVVEIWQPILEALEQETGLSLHLRTSSRIPDFERDFMAGNFDFAYMNPYHSLIALKEQGYTPVIRDSGRKLFGVVVVHKDSPYQDIQSLQGKRIAFPSPNSLGASLLIRSDLEQQYQLPYQASYVQTHSSVYLNVALHQAEAGGGVMSTLNAQPDAVKNNLRVIYHTTKLNPHPVSAHPRVLPEHAADLRDAFIKLAETEQGRAMLSKVPILKPVEATIDDYLPIDALHLENYLKNM